MTGYIYHESLHAAGARMGEAARQTMSWTFVAVLAWAGRLRSRREALDCGALDGAALDRGALDRGAALDVDGAALDALERVTLDRVPLDRAALATPASLGPAPAFGPWRQHCGAAPGPHRQCSRLN